MTTSPTQPDRSSRSSTRTLLIWLGVGTVATVFLGLVGLAVSLTGVSIGASPMACAHWHNIMSDVRAGVLTDPELRTKISEVRNSATDYSVKSAATDLLSAVTRRDRDAILDAADDLESACK